jgi:hypothetical protein
MSKKDHCFRSQPTRLLLKSNKIAFTEHLQ